MFLCVYVSLCVFMHSHGQTVWLMTLLFGMGVDLDLSKVGIVGQGQGHQVKFHYNPTDP